MGLAAKKWLGGSARAAGRRGSRTHIYTHGSMKTQLGVARVRGSNALGSAKVREDGSEQKSTVLVEAFTTWAAREDGSSNVQNTFVDDAERQTVMTSGRLVTCDRDADGYGRATKVA